MFMKKAKRVSPCSMIIVVCLYSLSFGGSVELLPDVDGTYSAYYPQYECWCTGGGPDCMFACSDYGIVYENISSGIGIRYSYQTYGVPYFAGESILSYAKGIMEFNLTPAVGMFEQNQIAATLILTVKEITDGAGALILEDYMDQNENGILETVDAIAMDPAVSTQNFNSLQPGDIISFDVTDSVFNDLFNADQTDYSGFILSTTTLDCTFYDHTDSVLGPKLLIEEQTLITLKSITAKPFSGNILIQWSTESEVGNAGFNIYRADFEDGEYVKINDSLIPAEGTPTQGSAYQFTDENVQNRKTYYYKLEDIDLNGTSTLHGPVNATPRLIHFFQ